MSVARRVVAAGLALLVLAVSNPPSYFIVLLNDLQVTLYLDIPDLDEDIFVRTCTPGCVHQTCYTYKEESRNDYGRKEKVLFKVKFEFCLFDAAGMICASSCYETVQPSLSGHGPVPRILERPPNIPCLTS